MKITIELKSGKKLELTETEIQELIRMFTTQQELPIPVWPAYPAYPTFHPNTIPVNPLNPWPVTC